MPPNGKLGEILREVRKAPFASPAYALQWQRQHEAEGTLGTAAESCGNSRLLYTLAQAEPPATAKHSACLTHSVNQEHFSVTNLFFFLFKDFFARNFNFSKASFLRCFLTATM